VRESRNPFRLRASESIEVDALFVRLFGPGALEQFKDTNPLEGLHVIRSTPGGGKTTLLRLFTPGPLLHLHAQKSQDDCEELWGGMKNLGALTEDGPTVLGILLSGEQTYATLADLGTDPAGQTRLFFALLDSRIVLAGIRAALQLRRLEYPSDLDRITLSPRTGQQPPPGLTIPCTGRELFKWASQTEAAICRAVDSFEGLAGCAVRGSDTLASLAWFRADLLKVDGQIVAPRTLVMLDDVHKLAPKQRQHLRDTLANSRTTAGIWLAERLQALSAEEMLAEGANAGRDYRKIISMEEFWRANHKRFEQLVFNISDRRARQAPGREMQDFRSCLDTTLDLIQA
jgi:hypothetical protein